MPSPSLPTHRLDVESNHEPVRTDPDRERHGRACGEVPMPRDGDSETTKRRIAELGLRNGLDEAASPARQDEETASEPAGGFRALRVVFLLSSSSSSSPPPSSSSPPRYGSRGKNEQWSRQFRRPRAAVWPRVVITCFRGSPQETNGSYPFSV